MSFVNSSTCGDQNWDTIEQGPFFYSTLTEKLESKIGPLYAWHKVRKWLGDWGIMAQVDRSVKWKACASAVQFKLGQLEEGAEMPEKVRQVAEKVLVKLPEKDLLDLLLPWLTNPKQEEESPENLDQVEVNTEIKVPSPNDPQEEGVNPSNSESIDQFHLSSVCKQLIRIKAGDQEKIDESDLGAATQAELRLIVLFKDQIFDDIRYLLHAAIESGCRELARHLIHEDDTDLNLQSPWGWTPLHHAVFSNDWEMVQELVEAGASKVEEPPYSCCQPKELAGRLLRSIEMEEFLEPDDIIIPEGVDVMEFLWNANGGGGPKKTGVQFVQGQLHQLISEGDESEACRLIASLVAQSSSELRPLGSWTQVGKALYGAWSLSEYEHMARTPLEIAVINQRIHVVNALVKAGAERQCRTSFSLNKLIQFSIERGFEEGAILLIERGDFQTDSSKEWLGNDMRWLIPKNCHLGSPVKLSKESYNRICKAFIDKGIGLDELGRNRLETPLQEAIREENTEIALYLIEKGVDLALKDGAHGRTAAHFAVQARDYQVLSKLVERDIDLGIKDNDGETAMSLAEGLADEEAIQIIGNGRNIKG